eukprot:3940744-Rhodomonas_salina.6
MLGDARYWDILCWYQMTGTGLAYDAMQYSGLQASVASERSGVELQVSSYAPATQSPVLA